MRVCALALIVALSACGNKEGGAKGKPDPALKREATRLKGPRSELNGMFAELHRAESQYALEMGTYLSATVGDEAWKNLRIQPPVPTLQCEYSIIAGRAGDPVPAFEAKLGMEPPAGNWYALRAVCKDGAYSSNSVDTAVKQTPQKP